MINKYHLGQGASLAGYPIIIAGIEQNFLYYILTPLSFRGGIGYGLYAYDYDVLQYWSEREGKILILPHLALLSKQFRLLMLTAIEPDPFGPIDPQPSQP